MNGETRLVFGQDREVAEWVRLRLPDPPVAAWGPMAAIGVECDGEPVAGVVYNNFHWCSIEASIASVSPAWCSRRNLAAVFAFPFHRLGVTRLGAMTAAGNCRARKFLRRLGFREEGVLRAMLPGDDAVLYGMTPSECRWLPAKGTDI